jgi:rhodanese-related sulfurtransferase
MDESNPHQHEKESSRVTNTSPVRQADVQSVVHAVGDGATLIDVREAFEFGTGHVPQAVSIPMHLVPLRLDELIRDGGAGQPVYVMCQSGNRSWQVCHYLGQHGIEAINVAGGMGAWQSAGLPVAVPGEAVAVGGAS